MSDDKDTELRDKSDTCDLCSEMIFNDNCEHCFVCESIFCDEMCKEYHYDFCKEWS